MRVFDFHSGFRTSKYHCDMNSDFQDPVCNLGRRTAPGAEASATAGAVAVAGPLGGAARLRDYILSRVAGLEVASLENVRGHLTLCTARKP